MSHEPAPGAPMEALAPSTRARRETSRPVRMMLVGVVALLVGVLVVPSAGAQSSSPETIGVVRGGEFFLREDPSSRGVDASVWFGRGVDEPLLGDWNGDGTKTVGVRRGNRFLLRNSNSAGPAEIDFRFGRASDEVGVGDWNGDGVDTVGVRRGSRFLLRDRHRGGAADEAVYFGRSGDVPVTGDWDGDGVDTVGVRRGSRFLLRDSFRGGSADQAVHFGRSGDVPLIGDWDGDGVDTVGVRRGDRFLLRNSFRGGASDLDFHLGRATDRPLAGVWRGTAIDESAFRWEVSRLPAALRERMMGVSWREGCPVGLDDLRLVELTHHDFAGRVQSGRLVVHRGVTDLLEHVFATLYRQRFPLERVELIENYDGDDDASMAANNTHAFNCRQVTGGSDWSAHAYGTAIDLNPVQNPYVRGGRVSPSAGARYTDRSDVRRGMLVEGRSAVRAFDDIGWGWGGRWASLKDYMHFSASGR